MSVQIQTSMPEEERMYPNQYDLCLGVVGMERARSMKGEILIRPEDREWEVNAQGRLFFYLNPYVFTDTASQNWWVFIKDDKYHSGKHRHQGGLVIYVLEGKGYTIIDGKRFDWEKGDLLLLPIKPEGVEHQHFNLDPNVGCKWMAFIYLPYYWEVATELTHLADAHSE